MPTDIKPQNPKEPNYRQLNLISDRKYSCGHYIEANSADRVAAVSQMYLPIYTSSNSLDLELIQIR